MGENGIRLQFVLFVLFVLLKSFELAFHLPSFFSSAFAFSIIGVMVEP